MQSARAARISRRQCLSTVLTGGTVLGAAIVEGKFLDDTSSDQSSWRVGLSRVRITPEGPIPMCGYSPHLSEGVLDDLFAKAMVIDDGHNGHVVLLMADLLFFRQPFSEALCQRIIAKTGLDRCQILLNASHTHVSCGGQPRGALCRLATTSLPTNGDKSPTTS